MKFLRLVAGCAVCGRKCGTKNITVKYTYRKLSYTGL